MFNIKSLLSFGLLALPKVFSQSTFTNPVLWEDLADNDVFRVNDTYYYTSSTMHYSPGAPILRSYDLVNWEYISHAVPTLAWGSKYDLAGGQAYVKGIWASTMRYRKSTNQWYWLGCIEFGKTYIYTAPSVTGPWTQKATLNTCYYDAGYLVDDDGTMYVAYGNTDISVAQMSADGLSQTKTQKVFTSPSNIGTLEGSRFYKRNGKYYISVTRPANAQWVWQASSPWGPYTQKNLVQDMKTPIAGGGIPHQGSLVDTPDGKWYYMAFVDSYPGGRMPVLAPITWGSDGFPAVTQANGGWGTSYPYPATPHPLPATTGTDKFGGTALSPQWEWNHNPDTSKFTVNNGLKLSTVTVTKDLYAARNTLTHRIHGPGSTATILINVANMADGDTAGLATFRDQSAFIAVLKSGSSYSVANVAGLTQDISTWATTSTGSTKATAAVTPNSGKLWLRSTIDIKPSGSKQATYYYSMDGSSFKQLGGAFTLTSDWRYFMGYRWGIFNYATKATGGSVQVNEFTTV
jgi:beta-xylosidase